VRHSHINTLAVCATLVGAALSADPAAAQQAYTTLECRAGTVSSLARTDDGVNIFALDHRGVQQSTHESKLFHNWSQRCVGAIANLGSRRGGSGYCRNQDPATGDFVIIQFASDEQRVGSGTFKLVHGTGKWKGVSGGGTYESSGAFRPVDEGTYQNCITSKGTVLIPGRQ
jgi:hypothetical protein